MARGSNRARLFAWFAPTGLSSDISLIDVVLTLSHATISVAMPGLEVPGDFLRHAVLETVVPHAPGLDIEGALTSALEDGADDLPSVLSSIPQRSLLFFGMREIVIEPKLEKYSLPLF